MIIRDMPLAEYHANSNASHSSLRDFAISPKLYETKHLKPGLAALLEDDDDESVKDAVKASKALVFGQAFETYLTDMPAFDKLYIQKPSQGKQANFSTTPGKEWRDAAIAQGKIILTVKEFTQLREMRESFLENEDAVELLENCEQQVTLTCQWPDGEIWAGADFQGKGDLVPRGVVLQSRPDFFSAKGCALSEWRPYSVDLKTVDHMERFYSVRAPLDYGYHRQAEIVRICMRENGLAPSVHFLLASEKSSPNRTELFEVEDELLDAASSWVFNNCSDLAEAKRTGHFPRAREQGVKRMARPAWLKEDDY